MFGEDSLDTIEHNCNDCQCITFIYVNETDNVYIYAALCGRMRTPKQEICGQCKGSTFPFEVKGLETNNLPSCGLPHVN